MFGLAPDPRNAGHSHISTLDGLRGVAAFAVLAHHIGLVRNQGGLFTHAYLAVDFFFLLSGFVMGMAYERKMSEGLSFVSFMSLRLGRLYPMVLMGAVLGCAVAFFQKQDFALGFALAAQLVFLPFAVSRDDAYPLNNVQWSLFFEIFVNALHGACHKILSTPVVVILVVASGLSLMAVDYYFGNLAVGYSWVNFIGGFPRVVFSYFIGLLIFRMSHAARFRSVKMPYLCVAALLIVLLSAPKIAFLRDSVFVIALFPGLLILSLGSTSPPVLMRVAVWSGAMSYPLYAVHAPLLRLAVLLLPTQANGVVHGVYWALSVAVIVAIAWALEHFYDAPIRRWLVRRRRAGLGRRDVRASS